MRRRGWRPFDAASGSRLRSLRPASSSQASHNGATMATKAISKPQPSTDICAPAAGTCAAARSAPGLRRIATAGRVEREVELQHVDARLAEDAEQSPLGVLLDQLPHLLDRQSARPGHPRAWYIAPATLMCGSRPLPEAVTRSTGTGAVLPGSAARSASMRALTASASAGLSGPWFEPPEAAAL